MSIIRLNTDILEKKSLNDIIDEAADGDVIAFDESLDGKTIDYRGVMISDKSLTIDATQLENGITLHDIGIGVSISVSEEDEEEIHFFDVLFGSDKCREITFKNIKFTGISGGYFLNAFTGGVTKIKFRDCEICYGGVIATNTLFREKLGEGLALDEEALQISFHNCKIQNCGNSALTVVGAKLFMKNCEVLNNASRFDGGGIQASFSTIELEGCKISNNRAGGRGSAIFSEINDEQSSITIKNCKLENNISGDGGEQIIHIGGELHIVNCEFD